MEERLKLKSIKFKITSFFFLSGVASLMLQCAPQTRAIPLPIELPSTFSEEGVNPMPQRWWTSFRDTTLNSIVERALQSNFPLQTARQRLLQAQAIVDRQSSSLLPFIDGFADAQVQRSEIENSEQVRLGLAARYELDLWGRLGSAIKAERFRATASYMDYQTANVTLSAQVVRIWFQLIEAQHQLELDKVQIETNEQVLSLIRTRFGSGQIRSVDILRQQQLLESTREQKIIAERRLEVLQHQLAVLLGRPQNNALKISPDFPQLPPLPTTGVPMELVRRRPDIQTAYYELLAADRDLASAISNQYPRLSVSASISTTRDQATNLFENWLQAAAGNVLAPIFYGGQLRAEVDQSQALKKQRLYEYGQATLIAFQEVEDALVLEKSQLERIKSHEKQMALSKQTLEQLRLEYLNGISNYLDVLTALVEQQRLERTLLTAKLTLFEYRISLYRALAGGFETSRKVTIESAHY